MTKKKILVVGNDPTAVGILIGLFQGEFVVLGVRDLQETVKKLKRHTIDILIFCKAVMNAAERKSFEKIKRDYPKIKRLLLLDEVHALRHLPKNQLDWACVFIKKPFYHESLQNIIRDLIQNEFFNDEFSQFKKSLSAVKQIVQKGMLVSYFQPIAQFEPFQVFGHELFTNGPINTPFAKPSSLISLAHLGGFMMEFEQAARESAFNELSNYRGFPDQLFLNNCPAVILNPEFENTLMYDRLGLKPENIVIEVNESSTLDLLDDFIAKSRFYRSKGFKISIDDVGKDHSGLFLVTQLKPDYAKLDVGLVKNISQSPQKMLFVSNLVEYAYRYQIKLIAEGIETREQMETLQNLGINRGQGYYLGKPSPLSLQ